MKPSKNKFRMEVGYLRNSWIRPDISGRKGICGCFRVPYVINKKFPGVIQFLRGFELFTGRIVVLGGPLTVPLTVSVDLCITISLIPRPTKFVLSMKLFSFYSVHPIFLSCITSHFFALAFPLSLFWIII